MPALKATDIFKNKLFLSLWSANAISLFGDCLTRVALMLVLFQLSGGSNLYIGFMLLASGIPPLFLAGFIGSFIDQYRNEKKVMIVSDLLRAVIVGVIPFISNPSFLIGLIALHSIVTAFFRPAMSTLLPLLVTVQELEKANSYLSLTYHFMRLLGALSATSLLLWISLESVFFIDALTFIISAAILTKINAGVRSNGSTYEKKNTGAGEAMVYIFNDHLVLIIFIIYLAIAISGGFHNTLELGLVVDIIRAPSESYFYIVAASGLGGVIASWTYPKISGLFPKVKTTLFLLSFSAALLYICYAFCSSITTAAITVFILNFVAIILLILMMSSLQKRVPETLRGRVFSLQQNMFFSVMYISSGVAGLVGDHLGIQFGLVAGGAIMIVILLTPLAFRRNYSMK